MEERKSWLPAGLEGSGWEPDDRSSQRSGAGSKRSGEGADASSPGQPKAEKSPDRRPSASSGSWQPYDPDRPESKRAQKDAETDEGDSRQAEEPKADRDRESEQGARSDVDAMGQDKHRSVVGQRVGASRTKQLAYYGTFVAFVIVAYLGLKIAVDHLDKAPAHDKAQAPWSQKNAPDEPLGGFTPKAKGEKGPTNFQ